MPQVGENKKDFAVYVQLDWPLMSQKIKNEHRVNWSAKIF